MTAPRPTRYGATPRGPQWAVEPKRRWRGWAQALGLLLVLVATGVDRVTL